MAMPPKLSVIVIARNEERDLPACLESLKGVADEIVVVMPGSDKT
jgi:glycosyltransferase involved in cell wall biosynthesis